MADRLIPPLPYRWNGRALVALHPKLAARHMVDGEAYMMAEHRPRSQASHDHYFAVLHQAWLNLPDDLGERFPTAEHMRKFALIKAGYRDVRSIACSSRAEALKVAGFIRPMDEYAVVTTEAATVTVATAKSQAIRAMGKREFEASKAAVLDVVAEMIGVTVDELTQNANAE